MCQKVHRKLLVKGIRVEIDSSSATVSYKIRQAELQKIPYMIICGKREAKSRKISVRKHVVGNIGLQTISGFVKHIKTENIQ